MTTPIPSDLRGEQQVAEIVAKLTKAQRRWLVSAEPNASLGGALATYPPSSTCKVLHRLGLWWWCGMLNDLGLAVRASLLHAEEKEGE